jgi:glycerol uptake facilitator-like aquaporin
MSFEKFAAVDYGQEQEEEEREEEQDMDLPGRGAWVEARHFMGIMFCWTLLECFDFLYLSPTTQGKLHGSISPAVSRLAVRMRIFAILRLPYIPPQFRGAAIGQRGPYDVLERHLMAETYNSAQRIASITNPVVVRPGNGATMNDLIRQVHGKVQDQAASRH